jgi:hypothetical protein
MYMIVNTAKITGICISILLFTTAGCINNSKKDVKSLQKYSDIITVSDLRSVISYPGAIERTVTGNSEGIHLIFEDQSKPARNKDSREILVSREILITHIEYLKSSKADLIQDMKTSEALAGIGDHAWFTNYGKGNIDLIFYIADKNILVGLEGHAEGAKNKPSTFVNREGLVYLARLIEERL